ncbi:hypothetical protein ACLMJK_008536 [Lecanora helva]
MAVHVQLDKPHAHFTNLDFISGRIVLSIRNTETISNINVKLEAESRSRLYGLSRQYDTLYDRHERDQALLEVHKLPFNNDCTNNNSLLTNLNALRLEVARPPNNHVKKTLPPSLNGLPGEAEIRYYVKATVQRPAFYKENFRAVVPFMFLPIEPPRQPPTRRESFARRSHQFSPAIDRPEKPGLFRKPSTPSEPSAPDVPPPSISIECRLPDPPIVTCNEALPIRILITRKNQTPATIYLQTLSIMLIGYTDIRAHELRRQEAGTWVIMSLANIHKPINRTVGNDGSAVFEVDPKLWDNLPLPNTVCPTFATCNISRYYELEVKIGLSWGSPSKINPELTIQPLKMPLEIYSGIAPPQALLEQMAGRPSQPPAQSPYMASNLYSPGSSSRPPPGRVRPTAPQPPSDHVEPSPSDIPDEAPPSYEDAIADELAPIDGPRRDYHQTPTQSPSADEKNSGRGGRLFPDSDR